jgi:hypothetical protein
MTDHPHNDRYGDGLVNRVTRWAQPTDDPAKIIPDGTNFGRPGYLLGGSEGPPRIEKRRTFLQANDAPMPYSDRKAMGDTISIWPIEDTVYAQNRACEGASNDEIAAEMGQPYHEVARVLNTEPKAERQARAEVMRPDMKPRRRGFF